MTAAGSRHAIAPAFLAGLLAAVGLLNSFASDMFLPALRAMARDLGATQVEAQQSVSLYFLACAFMSLWHGAIADACGRRRTVLACLAVLAISGIACLAVRAIGELWALRVVQGLAAGAGVVISRAIVLDLHQGLAAQRLLGRITAIQTLAPIATPLIGGWITLAFGWRGVFVALAAIAALLALAVARWLPETLPPERRQPLRPAWLAKGYAEVLGSRTFLRLATAHVANWGSMILYVVAAPAFAMGTLGRDESGVWLVFAPIMLGLLAGFALMPAIARRRVSHPALRAAYAALAAGVALNLALGALLPPGVHNLLPLFVQSVGVALAMPSLVGMALEPFGERTGLAASCHTFLQFAATAAIAGILAPLLWHSPALLALGSAALTAAGALALWCERAARLRDLRPSDAARRSR